MSNRGTGSVAARLAAVPAVLLLLGSVPAFAAGPEIGKGGVTGPLGADRMKGGAAAPAGSSQKALAPPASGPPAALPAEPKWPQNFELGAGERTGFGFLVGSPGKIAVTVKWQGAPLVVTLAKPGGGTVERTGNGGAKIEYTATAEDVKNGVLWSVGFRPARETAASAAAAGSRVVDRPLKARVEIVAKGTVTVTHPPGDMARAQGELAARAEKMAARAGPASDPRPHAEVVSYKQTVLAKQQTARQAQLMERIRATIPSVKRGGVSDDSVKPSLGGTGEPLPGTSSTVAAGSKTFVPAKGPRTAFEPGGMTIGGVVPGTSSTQSGQTGTAGSTQPNTVAPPAIASLSVADGQPGDPVLLSGSGFSGTAGEVRFVIGPNPQQDLPAAISSWSDTQIFVTVPDATGVTGFNGLVYVKRGNTASAKVPFRFHPAQEVRVLDHGTADRFLATPFSAGVTVCHPACSYGFNLGFLMFGGKGDDEYYRNASLKNGWVVDSANLAHLEWQSGGGVVELPGPSNTANANSYISELNVGTSSPRVKVHWWYDAGGRSTGYVLRLWIRGPKGVPHL